MLVIIFYVRIWLIRFSREVLPPASPAHPPPTRCEPLLVSGLTPAAWFPSFPPDFLTHDYKPYSTVCFRQTSWNVKVMRGLAFAFQFGHCSSSSLLGGGRAALSICGSRASASRRAGGAGGEPDSDSTSSEGFRRLRTDFGWCVFHIGKRYLLFRRRSLCVGFHDWGLSMLGLRLRRNSPSSERRCHSFSLREQHALSTASETFRALFSAFLLRWVLVSWYAHCLCLSSVALWSWMSSSSLERFPPRFPLIILSAPTPGQAASTSHLWVL